LRVGEKFRNDPEGFDHALKSPDYSKEEGFKDPFLGDEIFEIQNPYLTDIFGNIEGHWFPSENYLFNILDGCELYFYAGNSWYSSEKGKKYVMNYKSDPNLKNRPAQTAINAKDINGIEEKTLELLRKYRLDRVASSISIFQNPKGHIFGKTDSSRNIGISFSELNEKTFDQYPNTMSTFVYHEVGHALMRLLPYLTDSRLALKHRNKINEICRIFSPFSNLESFFKPQGKYESLLLDFPEGMKRQEKAARTLNFAYIANYPSWFYIPFASDVRLLLEQVDGIIEKREKRDVDSKDKGLVYRFFKDNKEFGEPADDLSSFKSYFEKISNGNEVITPFEKLIFEEIRNNVAIFEATERTFYDIRKNWGDYTRKNVIPMVVAEVLRKEPEKFWKSLIDTVKDSKYFKIIKHQVNLLSENLERAVFNEELFCEIFQSALRRRDKGIINEISIGVWKEVDETIKGLLDDLISEGLAINTEDNKAVM